MAWIGISTRDDQRFSLAGLGSDSGRSRLLAKASATDSMLSRGTVLVEAVLPSEDRAITLLAFQRMNAWETSFSLRAIPGRGIVLVIQQGDRLLHATIGHENATHGETIRFSYAWDAPARTALLTLEVVGQPRTVLVPVSAPPPLLISDLRAAFSDPRQREMDEETTYIALSDEIEPVGPQPTLSLHANILTDKGFVAAGRVKAGDTVRAMSGKLVPVLATIRRTVPALGSFAPVMLRAPYFGLREDVLVAPDQRLVIGGSDVEYMFGEEQFLVPARHLVNGTAAIHALGGPTVTWTQLVLPAHEALQVSGTQMESLFISRLRRKPKLLACSLLCDVDRGALPEHAQSSHLVLRHFEAITLAHRRAA